MRYEVTEYLARAMERLEDLSKMDLYRIRLEGLEILGKCLLVAELLR